MTPSGTHRLTGEPCILLLRSSKQEQREGAGKMVEKEHRKDGMGHREVE
jgi:hypothetical protein